MTFLQFLSDNFGWIFLFCAFFGGAILTFGKQILRFIGDQLEAHRQFKLKQDELRLQIERERRGMISQPKEIGEQEIYQRGYSGERQMFEE